MHISLLKISYYKKLFILADQTIYIDARIVSQLRETFENPEIDEQKSYVDSALEAVAVTQFLQTNIDAVAGKSQSFTAELKVESRTVPVRISNNAQTKKVHPTVPKILFLNSIDQFITQPIVDDIKTIDELSFWVQGDQNQGHARFVTIQLNLIEKLSRALDLMISPEDYYLAIIGAGLAYKNKLNLQISLKSLDDRAIRLVAFHPKMFASALMRYGWPLVCKFNNNRESSTSADDFTTSPPDTAVVVALPGMGVKTESQNALIVEMNFPFQTTANSIKMNRVAMRQFGTMFQILASSKVPDILKYDYLRCQLRTAVVEYGVENLFLFLLGNFRDMYRIRPMDIMKSLCIHRYIYNPHFINYT